MSLLLDIFTANILPVFLIAGIGYLLSRTIEVDPRTISRVVFYIFSPALVFTLIAQSEIDAGNTFRLAGLAVLTTAAVGVVAWLVGRALKLDRRMLVALLLTTILVNAGNYGLSVNAFAYGEQGKAYASVFFVTTGTIAYTVGVILASLGKASMKEAFIGLLKYPVIYALVLAFVFKQFDWSLPLPIDRSITLLSEAAIPSMIVLLGMQLRRIEWNSHTPVAISANLIRLVGAPLIAIGLATLLGLSGVARKAGILEASMPSAVMSIVLATEFDVEPAFVTTVVTTTTLLSPLTLTPLLALLGV